MKKFLLLTLFATLVATSARSASVLWNADWTGVSIQSTEIGEISGTAYLIASSSTINIDNVVTHLTMNGATPPDGEGVFHVGAFDGGNSQTITSTTGFPATFDSFGGRNFISVSFDSMTGTTSYDSFFMLILKEGGKEFIVATLNGDGDYMGSGIGTSEQLFFNDNSNWQSGTIGVPEPTALALLALGMAGLALKRRVA